MRAGHKRKLAKVKNYAFFCQQQTQINPVQTLAQKCEQWAQD